MTDNFQTDQPKSRKSLGFLVVKIKRQQEQKIYGRPKNIGTRRVLLDGACFKQR